MLSYLFLFALLLSSPLSVLGSPLSAQKSSSLSRRLAEAFSIDVASSVQKRDVVRPRITSPTASSVWPIGSTQTVTWDTSDFPPYDQITNKVGRVILGRDTGDSLNLDIDHPLAQGFNITDGKVDIRVPNVPPRKDYLIVLMGDSGNTSPSFAITAISAGPGSSSSSSVGSSSSSSSPVSPASSTVQHVTPTSTAEDSPTSTAVNDLATTTTTAAEATTSAVSGSTTSTPESSSTGTSQQVLGNSANSMKNGCWMTVLGVVSAGMILI